MKNQYFLLFAILLFLYSCGPTYRTDYNYTPPKTVSGVQCTSACQMTQQQCELLQEQKYETCRTRAELEFNRCEKNKRFRINQKTGERECVRNCSCFRSYCSRANSERCASQYRACYTNCGGRVTSHTYCVSNCEEVNKQN